MIGLWSILLIKSKRYGAHAELCLCEQGREKDAFLDAPTVIRV